MISSKHLQNIFSFSKPQCNSSGSCDDTNIWKCHPLRNIIWGIVPGFLLGIGTIGTFPPVINLNPAPLPISISCSFLTLHLIFSLFRTGPHSSACLSRITQSCSVSPLTLATLCPAPPLGVRVFTLILWSPRPLTLWPGCTSHQQSLNQAQVNLKSFCPSKINWIVCRCWL